MIPESAFALWDYHCFSYQPPDPHFDAVIGLGSYDDSVATFAVQTQASLIAKTLLFTGNKGNWTHGLYDETEAEHFGLVAQKAGAAAGVILLENTATNIAENISRSEAMLGALICSAMYVTKPQTQRRLFLSLQATSRLQSYGVVAPQRSLENAIALFGEDQILSEMVGDMHRMIHYPKHGWMVNEIIPEPVLDACKDLIVRGYINHMLPGISI